MEKEIETMLVNVWFMYQITAFNYLMKIFCDIIKSNIKDKYQIKKYKYNRIPLHY